MTDYKSAPKAFLAEDGGPSAEIMALVQTGITSLDWTFDLPESVPAWFERWKQARDYWAEVADNPEPEAARGAETIEAHAFSALLVPPVDLEDAQAQAKAVAILKETEDDSDAAIIAAIADSTGSFERRISIAAQALDIEEFSVIERDADGDAIMTDAMLTWVHENGISLDWLAVGDVRGMIRASAGVNRRANDLAHHMDKMDKPTLAAFSFVLQSVLSGHITAEEASEQLLAAKGLKPKA